MFQRTQQFCIRCTRQTANAARHYRSFLLSPETIVTIISGTLLLAAMLTNPAGMLDGGTVPKTGRLLYLASALSGSAYIWWSALQGIREGDFTADIPVSLATAASIAIGQYSAAAVVAVLLLAGGLLEGFVAARADHAVEALAKLLPDRVSLRLPDGDHSVPLNSIRPGDILLVHPGERIAVDGEVCGGISSVNQAAITGESRPVHKSQGDSVFAGTLNESGALHIKTVKTGDDTTLGHIRRLIEEAQSQKAPIERTLSRYARLYTPAAILLGAALWAWSGDILRAITVLIVFCPCVMVLATPTALVASIGNAALHGSLVKRGATIESLEKIDAVLFDKTGTLTLSQPRLSRIIPLDGLQENELLQLAAAAEKFSEHPLGKAIVKEALQRKIEVKDPQQFLSLPGQGVQADIEGTEVLVGRNMLPATTKQAPSQTGDGQTAVHLWINQKEAGIFLFDESIRPQARETVQQLKELGITVAMVSGDNEESVKRVAAELGVDEYHAGVMPQDKVDIVRELQSRNKKVVFVGDGVNDGPALAAADVGIAMGAGGTDVAIETAQVALLADELWRVPHLLTLSRRAMRAIRQNLAFSLAVLGLAVTLTISGRLTPVSGALLHELSSIPVIMNSARLIRSKNPGMSG